MYNVHLLYFEQMDVEQMWILWQDNDSPQFRMLFSLSFIGQFVHTIGGEERGEVIDWGIVILARYKYMIIVY